MPLWFFNLGDDVGVGNNSRRWLHAANLEQHRPQARSPLCIARNLGIGTGTQVVGILSRGSRRGRYNASHIFSRLHRGIWVSRGIQPLEGPGDPIAHVPLKHWLFPCGIVVAKICVEDAALPVIPHP